MFFLSFNSQTNSAVSLSNGFTETSNSGSLANGENCDASSLKVVLKHWLVIWQHFLTDSVEMEKCPIYLQIKAVGFQENM